MPPVRMATHILRFGDFEVDVVGREIRKGGVKRRLSGQPFDILCVLLRQSRKIVSREELKSQLWPKQTHGDFERGLNAAINKLRATLGDSAELPRYIQTIPRRGYRFIVPVVGDR